MRRAVRPARPIGVSRVPSILRPRAHVGLRARRVRTWRRRPTFRSGSPSRTGTSRSSGPRSRNSRSRKRRLFSSRGILKRARGSSCAPPGRQAGPRRSSGGRRLLSASRDSSSDFQSRPRANHSSTASGCRACSCRSVGNSSSCVCARKAVGLPSRMIVQ